MLIRLVGPLLACFGLVLAGCSAPEVPDTRPNILFILADDLGYMDTAVYGSQFYETPNIDRLAQSGLLFRNAYAASPLCTPTRASLLTGKHPSSLQITTAAGHLPEEILNPIVPESSGPTLRAIEPQSRTRLPRTVTTYAKLLQENGYRTGFMGKWHLGPEPYSPENNGFDHVIGGREHPGPPPPGNYFAPWNVQGLRDYPAGTHIADALATEAIEFVDEKDNRPFLLNLWFYDVHAPYQSQQGVIEKYEAKLKGVNETSPQRSPTMAAMIEEFDRHVGRVMDHLEEKGLLENTVIIFTSDNGGNMYDRIDGEFPTNNAPLRGGKGINFEGGVKVPLIISWPDQIPSGATTDVRTSSVDVFPTILELSSTVQSEPTHEGVSILQTLATGSNYERALFFDFPHYVTATGNIPNSAVVSDDWKLYRFFADNPDQSNRFELYNLSEDVGETTDVSEQHPEVVAQLDELIETHLQNTRALRPAKNPDYGKVGPSSWRGQGGVFSLESGHITLISTGNDPMFIGTGPLTDKNQVTLTFELKSSSSGGGQIFWTSASSPAFSEKNSQQFEVVYDGEWHHYEITVQHHEPLGLFRIDPSRATGPISMRNFKVH